MEDNCLIHYYCSTSYNPSSERGIRFNDPAFNFEWPTIPKVISDKDLSHPDF
jgi:dTDP-4-dehydrorhamnose 3,5-epimerase